DGAAGRAASGGDDLPRRADPRDRAGRRLSGDRPARTPTRGRDAARPRACARADSVQARGGSGPREPRATARARALGCAVDRAYVTRSVPFIPAAACPGTGQRYAALQALSVSGSFVLLSGLQ